MCGRRIGCCCTEHGKSERTGMTWTSLRQGQDERRVIRMLWSMVSKAADRSSRQRQGPGSRYYISMSSSRSVLSWVPAWHTAKIEKQYVVSLIADNVETWWNIFLLGDSGEQMEFLVATSHRRPTLELFQECYWDYVAHRRASFMD